MDLFSLFALTVYAAETIISPLPDSFVSQAPDIRRHQATFGQYLSSLPATGQVLGVQTEEALPPDSQAITPTPEPTQIPLEQPQKKSFSIALLGDSMIDTLGPEAPHLVAALKRRYPGIQFTIYNHGVGATNIEYGIERISNGYSYLGLHRDSLVSQNPDIVVVESFGYNPYPFEEGALNKHWLALATIVDRIRSGLPHSRIIIAATIAPSPVTFGDGAPSLAFSPSEKQDKVRRINSYLESTIAFAKSQNIPLADAYHPSLTSEGHGNERYINGGDHIHYSDAGRSLFGETVAQAITTHNLLR